MYDLYHVTVDNVCYFILVCNVLCNNHLLSWANHRKALFNYVRLSNNGRSFVLYSKYNHESRTFLYVALYRLKITLMFFTPPPPPTCVWNICNKYMFHTFCKRFRKRIKSTEKRKKYSERQINWNVKIPRTAHSKRVFQYFTVIFNSLFTGKMLLCVTSWEQNDSLIRKVCHKCVSINDGQAIT